MSLSDKNEFHHTLGALIGPWDDIRSWESSVYIDENLPRFSRTPRDEREERSKSQFVSPVCRKKMLVRTRGGIFDADRDDRSIGSKSFGTVQSHSEYPCQVIPRLKDAASLERSHVGPGCYQDAVPAPKKVVDIARPSTAFLSIPRPKTSIVALDKRYDTLRPRFNPPSDLHRQPVPGPAGKARTGFSRTSAPETSAQARRGRSITFQQQQPELRPVTAFSRFKTKR